MSILDDENKLVEQADENLKTWDEKRKCKSAHREYSSEYTWMIDGKRVKLWDNDFHLSSRDYSDFKCEVYRF